MKHIFIINKNDNNKKNYAIIEQIFNAAKGLNLDFKICVVDNVYEMNAVVSSYKNQNAIIYALNEDKTINLVLNELVGGRASLGIIPIGSENGFYRKLNEYDRDVIDANVMKVNDKFGLNIFSIGLDAEICANAQKMKKLNINSKYAYIYSLLYTFFKYKNKVIGINNYFEKMMFLTICNGSYYPGGLKISSYADITDDKLLVYMADDVKRTEMPILLYDIIKGKEESNEHISIFEAEDTIYVETYGEVVGQLDGEIIKGDNFVIEPNASQIRVINNRELIRKLNKK